MATFDLQEQEQLSELKDWWASYGNMLVGIVLTIALSFAGYRGWQYYHYNKAAQAETIYVEMMAADQKSDATQATKLSGKLIADYPSSVYASLSALIAGKSNYDKQDFQNAQAQLQWVSEEKNRPLFADLAKLRLAEMALEQKKYDEALALLKQTPVSTFVPAFTELRGDVLAAKNDLKGAQAAYQEAVDGYKKMESGEQLGQLASVKQRLLTGGGQ